MIVGVGIDICSIERMRKALGRNGGRVFERICSPRERAELAGRRDQALALAGRFAIKEAFSKVLDGARGIGWHECEVRRDPSGRPRLELSGNALVQTAERGGDTWHVSLTHDGGLAVAVAILEKTR